MARLFQAGWELNATTSQAEFETFTNATIVTSPVHGGGAYAMRCNTSASSAFVRQSVYTTDTAADGYIRFYYRVAAYPSVDSDIVRFVSAGPTTLARIRITSTGTLKLLDANPTQIGSASSALSLNTWYRIEMRMNGTAGTGTIEAKIDGAAAFASGTGSTGSWSQFTLGHPTTGTQDGYFDDFAINDASGSDQNSYPGPSDGLIVLRPNADTATVQWTTQSGTDHYAMVDDPASSGLDGDATYVSSNTANQIDMYEVDAWTPGAIQSAVVAARGSVKNQTATDATTAARLRIAKAAGGTVSESANIIPNSTSYRSTHPGVANLNGLILYKDPDGADWTSTTLGTANVGVKLITAGTNAIRFSAVWMSVDYLLSTTTPIAASDTGTGTDTAAVNRIIADTGTATESVSFKITLTDTGAGTDTAVANGPRLFTETGHGLDSATVTINFGEAVKANTVYETFANGLPPDWFVTDGTVTDSAGIIDMPTVVGVPNVITYNRAIDLTNSYIPMRAAPDTSADSFFAYRLTTDSLNYIEFYITYNGSSYDITFRIVTAGFASDTVARFDQAQDAWWRFRESGGFVYWDTSPNGGTWNNRKVATHSMLVSAMHLSIMNGANESGLYGVGGFGDGIYGE